MEQTSLAEMRGLWFCSGYAYHVGDRRISMKRRYPLLGFVLVILGAIAMFGTESRVFAFFAGALIWEGIDHITP